MPRYPLAPDSAALEQARRAILPFTRWTKPDYETNWHHALVAAALDRFARRELRRLMLFLPPRHGKSELVSRRLPAFLLGRNPDAAIIACSYGADLARTLSRDVQQIIDSPAYARLFPATRLAGANVRPATSHSYRRNADVFEVVDHRGRYLAAGVGGPITGQGFHFGVIDDPIKNREEADSPTYREKVWRWYTSTFYSRQEQDAGILLTVTRWHEDDLAGRLLALAAGDPSADQWEVLSLPAIAETPQPPDPRSEGDPLWPGKYALAQLHTMRATMGVRDWTALYQQRPTPDTGGALRRAWFRYYTQLPPAFDEVCQSWDMTFRRSAGSDYVVGQVWGRLGADSYLIAQVRARRDLPETIQAVLDLSREHPLAVGKLIEYTANGPDVIRSLTHQLVGLIPITPRGPKLARLAAISPVLQAGNVYLPALSWQADGEPLLLNWVQEFLAECTHFPLGSHDDQVDAMTQMLAYWYLPEGAETTSIEHLDVARVDLSGWDR